MKRDMELVRRILLFLEDEDRDYCEGEGFNYLLICIDGYSKEEVDYHLRIMKDGEIIKGELPVGDNQIITHSGVSLNWKGHDFLETFKDDGNWSEVKEWLSNKGKKVSDVPFDFLLEMGKEYFKNKFGMK